MGLLHINGSAVSPEELEERKLADELLWLEKLLGCYADRDPNIARMVNIADDALHFGAKMPYWQRVHRFRERHRGEILRTLRTGVNQKFDAAFHRRYGPLFDAIMRLQSNQSVEDYDVHLREYEAAVATAIHELLYYAGQRGLELSLDDGQRMTKGSVVSKEFDRGRFSGFTHATTAPNVSDGGVIVGKCDPVIFHAASKSTRPVRPDRPHSFDGTIDVLGRLDAKKVG